jgi:hypothetical protein
MRRHLPRADQPKPQNLIPSHIWKRLHCLKSMSITYISYGFSV